MGGDLRAAAEADIVTPQYDQLGPLLSNGKMDFNFIGLPTKGYGFSNDAKATLSPPSFSAASFSYSGEGSMPVPINIVYW